MDINTLTARLNAATDQISKAKDEIVAEIAALREALANVQVPAEAETSLTRLEGLAATLDDFNPDAPPPEPAP